MDSKLEWLRKQGGGVVTSSSGTEQQIAEFAGRGLLSSLIKMEQKIDNITKKVTHTFDQPSYRRNRVSINLLLVFVFTGSYIFLCGF